MTKVTTDYDAEMMNIDQQILQLFIHKLDLAQQAVQQKKSQGELLGTRGQDIEADATQLELSKRPEYRSYLQDLLRDLRIVTRQYQAQVYQKCKNNLKYECYFFVKAGNAIIYTIT